MERPLAVTFVMNIAIHENNDVKIKLYKNISVFVCAFKRTHETKN